MIISERDGQDLYICDPSKNTECKKSFGCQLTCFYTSREEARAGVYYIETHLINLLMNAYPDHKIIIKPKKRRSLNYRLKRLARILKRGRIG